MRLTALALTVLVLAATSAISPAVAADGADHPWEVQVADAQGDQRFHAFDPESGRRGRVEPAEKRVLAGTDLQSFRLKVKRTGETPFLRASFEVADVERRTRRLTQSYAVLLERKDGRDVAVAWVDATRPGASPVVRVDSDFGDDDHGRCRGATARLRYLYGAVVVQVPLSCLRGPEDGDALRHVRVVPAAVSTLRVREKGVMTRFVDAVDLGPRLKRVPLG